MSENELRELLYERAKRLIEKTSQLDEQVSSKPVEELEKIGRVIKVCDEIKLSHESPPVRKKWPVVGILVVSFVVVMLLLTFKRSTTEIETDLTVTEVKFTLSKPVKLIDKMKFSALGITDLREIQLPRTRDRDGNIRDVSLITAPQKTGYGIRLSSVSNGDFPGVITLTEGFTDSLFTEGTKVWLKRTDVPHQYRLWLKFPENTIPSVLQVNVEGTVEVGLSNVPGEQFFYKIPKSIFMKPASNEIALDLTLESGTEFAFSPQLYSKDLSFIQIDQFTDGPNTYVRRISTILSGELFLAELIGQKYTLRPGEGIQFENSDGIIRTLNLGNDQIVINFHGGVSGLTTGWDQNRKNLMPTWLEWLSARHSLKLLYGAALFIFGIAFAIYKFLKK